MDRRSALAAMFAAVAVVGCGGGGGGGSSGVQEGAPTPTSSAAPSPSSSPPPAPSPAPPTLVYSASADELVFAWRYSSAQDMRIKVGRYGPNSLNDIGDISVKNHNGGALSLSGAWTNIETRQTDWIGPYVVTAAANATGPTSGFTGGNHSVSASDARATAIQVAREVYADGSLVAAGTSGIAQELVVAWENDVMACNTMLTERRYVLKERHEFRIRPGSIEVIGRITALEDITIKVYYGLQAYRVGHNSTVHFFNGSSAARVPVVDNLNSGDVASYPNVWGATLREGDRNLTLWVDRSYGLGQASYLPASGFNLFFTSSGKIYNHFVNTTKMPRLSAGQELSWHGGYIFSQNQSTAADLAQRYFDTGKPKYLVAHTAAASLDVTIAPEDITRPLTSESSGIVIQSRDDTHFYASTAGYKVGTVRVD